jgi:hypothetical protein
MGNADAVLAVLGLTLTGTTCGQYGWRESDSHRAVAGFFFRGVRSKRSVLVFENRLLEILIYLIAGIIFLVLGLWSANVNYQVLFFILTAFFIFAIFRPTSLS